MADVYHMTEQQAEAVVRLQLGQLAALERDEILKEYAGLREQITGHERLLVRRGQHPAPSSARTWRSCATSTATPRKTEITDAGGRGQPGGPDPRGGRGREHQPRRLHQADAADHLPHPAPRRQGGRRAGPARRTSSSTSSCASTHAYLLCFTNRGQCHWLKVYDIPEAARTSGGRSIANVLTLKEDEKIEGVIPVRHFEENAYLLMATKNGAGEEDRADRVQPAAAGRRHRHQSGGGRRADRRGPGAGRRRGGAEHAATGWRSGSPRPTPGRWAGTRRGVNGIKLVGDDEVVGMVVADPEGQLLTVCENGYGKRTPFGADTADIGEEVDGEADGELEVEPPLSDDANGVAEAEPGEGGGALVDALPPAAARRQGREGHPHERAERPSGRRGPGPGDGRPDADHAAGHGDAHPGERDPGERAEHAGGAGDHPERGGQAGVGGQGGPGGGGGGSGRPDNGVRPWACE